MLQNGYMKPRQVQNVPPLSNYDQVPLGPPRHVKSFNYDQVPPGPPRQVKSSNYDQVPPGPPRPAPVPSRRHKSALLSQEGVETSVDENGHTYVNMQRPVDSAILPQITRSNKPSQPSPPRVNRRLKPRNASEASPGQEVLLDDSLTQPDLESAMARTSLMDDGEKFSESDIPRRSRGTMKYTQVQFDGSTRNPYLVESSSSSQGVVEEESKRLFAPAPLPRQGMSRVSYSDVDLDATRAQAEAAKKEQVYLEDAEQQALREKAYINVQKNGGVDDDTDPDYYTYMRVSGNQGE